LQQVPQQVPLEQSGQPQSQQGVGVLALACDVESGAELV
jgi:hypothetical protein